MMVMTRIFPDERHMPRKLADRVYMEERISCALPLSHLIDNPEAYTLVMGIIVQHNPEFVDRLKGQTEVTLRQAIYHNPHGEELGAKIETALKPFTQNQAVIVRRHLTAAVPRNCGSFSAGVRLKAS